MSNLMVGDAVTWRGAWGKDPAKLATVITISVCENPGDHSVLTEVESIDWSEVVDREVIVDIVPFESSDNKSQAHSMNHWAWGFQIDPIVKETK